MAQAPYQYSTSLSNKNGYLYCEGVKVKDIQESLQDLSQPSPFFLYSKAQIIANIESYRNALENNEVYSLLGFSIKANNNPNILKAMKEQTCTGIAVSGNELRLALELGFKGENLILNGNGKNSWEIELAVKNSCLVNVDSEFDLKHISRITRDLALTTRILLRLNPDIDSRVHPYLATGLAESKFGLEQCELSHILPMIKDDPHLELVGLHCHLGSTIDTVDVFSDCLDIMLKITEDVCSQGFDQIQFLNIGGGLGIDYRKHAYRTQAECESKQTYVPIPSPNDLILRVKERLKKTDICLILEPGRSLIGSAACLITKVIGCKVNGGTNFIVVDGSMTEVIRPSLYGAYHHIELTEPSQIARAPTKLYNVVGPVCECADYLGKERWLVTPHEGCGMVIFDAGAYCSSMSSNYNLRMRPAEILVDGSKWKIIRQPDSLQDLLKVYAT